MFIASVQAHSVFFIKITTEFTKSEVEFSLLST